MSVYCLDDMAYEELGKENEERRRETPEAPMNSDHAPTAPNTHEQPRIPDTPERILLIAACDALRSYQYGNGSPELAEEIANGIGLYFSGGKP